MCGFFFNTILQPLERSAETVFCRPPPATPSTKPLPLALSSAFLQAQKPCDNVFFAHFEKRDLFSTTERPCIKHIATRSERQIIMRYTLALLFAALLVVSFSLGACTVSVQPCTSRTTSEDCKQCCEVDNKARATSFINLIVTSCRCGFPSACDNETTDSNACETCCKDKVGTESYSWTASLCQCY